MCRGVYAGVFLPTKKIDKVAVAQSELQHQKKLSKFTEAVFANRVKGVSGSDLTMQYEALTEKNSARACTFAALEGRSLICAATG